MLQVCYLFLGSSRAFDCKLPLQTKIRHLKLNPAMAETITAQVETLHIHPRRDESRKMKVVEWNGKRSVSLSERGVPMITDPKDAIVKVTSTAICGSDLHLYHNSIPGMERGDILGHEFMGVVEAVGGGVSDISIGDRVVASFDIACGHCFYCKKGLFSSCDTTNHSKEQAKQYGHHTAGMYGYSHMTGGYDGGQAQFARVIYADVNLLKVPEHLTDEQVLFLSDILPTAWHANELGGVGDGDNVAIWGAGPVGILAAYLAKFRGAARVVLIDKVAYRLQFATHKIPNLETINFGKEDVLEELKKKFPLGPDVGIEAAGLHYAKSKMDSVKMKIGLETDTAEILNEIIMGVRKGGRIAVVGVYGGYCNKFKIGALMEKGLTLRAGQTPVQFYWRHLLGLVQKGELDPTLVITHILPMDQAPKAYEIFDEKRDNCVKIILKPQQGKIEETAAL